MPVPPPEILEVGSLLDGRYKVVKRIGRGGMGVVYLCDDQKLPGAQWAVKQMTAMQGQDLESMREGFRREALFLSELRHPGMPFVVDVLDSGESQFLVMEYVEGETLLDSIVNEGRPTDAQALDWGVELSDVLDYLHRQSPPVIFRDLKPENVMLSTEGHLKVIDFGLARHFEPSKHRETQTSGTVGYTAPEQWEDAEQTDARSDIFSLGGTLFFLLTGEPPGAVYSQIDLKKHRPNINDELESMVMKCMALKPEDRYQSAAEVRDELLRLGGSPGETLTPMNLNNPSETNLPDSGSASSFGLVALCFALVALLFYLPTLFQPSPQPTATPTLVEEPTVNHQLRAKLAEGRYTDVLSEADAILQTDPQNIEAYILRNNAEAAKSGKRIYRIPVVSSWHGVEGEGLDALFGWGLAQKHLNESREELPLIYLDLYNDNSKSEQLLEIVDKLAHNKEVSVLVGPWTSQQALLIAPMVHKTKLPVITPVASDSRVLSSAPDMFCVSDTDINKTRVLAEYLYKSGRRRATVLADRSRYVSRSMAGLFSESFEELGGEIVFQDAYSHNSLDFKSLLKEAKSRKSDCLFLAEYRADVVLNVCGEVKEGKWDAPVACQIAGFAGNFPADKSLAEGLLFPTTFLPEAMGDRQQAVVDSFSAEFQDRRFTHREAQVYDSLMLAVEALDNAGSEREKLSRYLTELGRERAVFSGLSGDFAPSKHLNSRQAFVLTIEDGGFRRLHP